MRSLLFENPTFTHQINERTCADLVYGLSNLTLILQLGKDLLTVHTTLLWWQWKGIYSFLQKQALHLS